MVEIHAGDESHIKRCRNIKFDIWRFHVNFNPVVTFCSAVIIWGLVIFCLVETEKAAAHLPTWTKWVTDKWTWLYIGTQDAWAVFILVLFFSKYSNLKLGKTDDEEPEFNDGSYFSMLFAAGIGVGLFYFGVAEPVQHYQPTKPGDPMIWGNRYQGRYSDNQRAQDAINVTLFHWGIHGWIVYTMIGLLLGFLSYRYNMPMTMRTCFYPLLGDKIYGTFGDLIDILSVVCTMFGVCTSLGAGAIQLNDGLNRLNSDIPKSATSQVAIIWVITAVATASVISGIKIGIRRLSEICFSLGMFIFFIIFFYDDTWFLLNAFVQSIGYYLQWIVQIGFHTDAFAQLGNAPDGKQAPSWMNDWTIFYWGWWIAWAPFVGVFIARISRGRTIKQFITYTLTVPILYCIMWFSIMGAVGIKMEREAALAGIQCNSTYGGTNSTASHKGLYRLSCRESTSMWFDVMNQYEGIGSFLSGISIVGLVLYFVTSSDSGSLVIDSLSANGHPDPPVLQRVFWALTEGACATGLLWTGGSKALSALQAVSVSSGLLYTVVLNFVCISIWRAVKYDTGDLDFTGPYFNFGLFDLFYSIPSFERLYRLAIAIFFPCWPMANAKHKIDGSNRWVTMVFLAVPFYGWVLLEIAEIAQQGLAYVGWSLVIGFVVLGGGIRGAIREKYKIVGNMAEDFFAVMLMYPLAAMQMEYQVTGNPEAKPRNDAEFGVNNYAMDKVEDKKEVEATRNPNKELDHYF
ncbi:glycine betaine transporter 1-like [Nematostella vectensis]|uniref:glycine betaine transporter 1-like n=1 Tax=Nematostella vectensis TaxID=45351 RepID=UPI002077671B|nr:glycine betaine transporter 1-like [Nematostella vectensis]